MSRALPKDRLTEISDMCRINRKEFTVCGLSKMRLHRLLRILYALTVNPPDSGEDSHHTEDFPQLNKDYIIHDENDQWHLDTERLFRDAFGNNGQIGGAALRTAVCQLSNIRSFKYYNTILDEVVGSGLLVKSHDGSGHVIYTLEATPF